MQSVFVQISFEFYNPLAKKSWHRYVQSKIECIEYEQAIKERI